MTQPAALTPKLRFPEFRNGPSWDGQPMGEAYSFKGNNSLSRDQLNYEHGAVKNIHYGDIHTKFSTLFDVTKETVPFINPSESLDGFWPDDDCVEGDMIFADASEDLADIGKSIELVRLNGERVVSGQHTIPARMIVRNDQRGCAGEDGATEDFARSDQGRVQRAERDEVPAQRVVLRCVRGVGDKGRSHGRHRFCLCRGPRAGPCARHHNRRAGRPGRDDGKVHVEIRHSRRR